ncbi:NAD(P)-dependent dehydrogenase (short-subunit alcohol dehydrogenase family) [Brevundimonas bullata]|uniref:NAD(P)-dependent dehydrogenase (Short-subunit alcohol dehydrogenase family) n=1 Tax=Brevundimonas bullata TaxID=13160 RepID=A0A7W7ILC7_9CAUL|nr:SDR family NAD(P)-dependent oxidoreductase [Brevundimonas bullata]MBB4796464.1 NAD(P)-dependent dehydrogenase (short-subunit alcohol dehydrogenase family) [Brevundimonas bullata]MBB6381424.1 NAD(P)-dependent dehydrogenase (short-subunit alcohol dehydrogenase family) [Brevundimonas bullata]
MAKGSAIIVGVSGGIGRALAQQLGQAGDRVVHGLSRTPAAPMEGVTHGYLDLEDETSMAGAAARIAEGPAPSLIVVATGVLHSGQTPERSWRELTAEHLMRDFRINAVGPALAARHLLPLMPRDQRAVFAALSARVGSIGDNRLGGWHSYRASKAALNMILKTLSVELARTHPQAVVAGLHPGTVDTALSAPFQRGVKPDKLFSPAFRLLAVIEGLTPADSGGVFAWDGAQIPA